MSYSSLNLYLHKYITDDYFYSSPFFPLYELRIADIFFSDDTYLHLWTSCNQATEKVNFCSNCAKCAFTYLIAMSKYDEESITNFFSSNLLDNVDLFKPLMDFMGEKPLDCVGDKKEVWLSIYYLFQKGNNSPVVQYFMNNIYPQVKEQMIGFAREVNEFQRVPIYIPGELTKLVEETLQSTSK